MGIAQEKIDLTDEIHGVNQIMINEKKKKKKLYKKVLECNNCHHHLFLKIPIGQTWKNFVKIHKIKCVECGC